jgi:hypothetical protein
MGEPVRIIELARAMIELCGLDPDRDIEIEIVGRRPGEKLGEDLFNSYERPRRTDAEKILLAEREALPVDAVEAIFEEIILLVLEGDAAGLAAKVAELSAARHQPLDGSPPIAPVELDAADAPEGPPEELAPLPAGASEGDSSPEAARRGDPLVHSPNP